ncbi:MAG: 16S rRNA (uracil(1498)-N(3))-methyltransferase [Candidatus Omnitrophica bacterium]|nr:16S rRNA (uracil(1498)-N(3))-methyltransferase [Candidatus Omnitrophota bacterium]
MSKVRLFLPKNEICDVVTVKDKDILHKANDVLALKKGQHVYLFDGEGMEYRYQITETSRRCISLKKEAVECTSNAPLEKITLGLPLLKEQKIELILQRATELGVWAYQPFICERSIREHPSSGKKERWIKIVQEATRQSSRLWLAQINEIIDFETLIKQDFSLKIAASIEGQKIIDITKEKYRKILLMIGPEGDFSPQEYEKLKANGFIFLKLSENILRVETAAIMASGIINYFLMR